VYIVLLGAPGAGKGTQAAIVAEELNLVHIASGDLFRQALEQGTELGLQAKSYMEKGMLVPDQITIRMGSIYQSLRGGASKALKRALDLSPVPNAVSCHQFSPQGLGEV